MVKSGNQISEYDAANGERLTVFAKMNLQNGGMAIGPAGRRIATGGYPSRVFDLETWGTSSGRSPVGSALPSARTVTGLRSSPTTVIPERWSFESSMPSPGRLVARTRAHSEFGGAVAYSPDGKYVATTGNDNITRLWDPGTAKEVRRFQRGAVEFRGGVQPGRADVGGRHGRTDRALAGGFRPRRHHHESPPDARDQQHGPVPGFRIVYLGAGLFGGRIDDATTRTTRAMLAGRFRGSTCAAFSGDGTRVAAGFGAGAVAVWDAATGTRIYDLVGLRDYVGAVAFSADGRRLAAAGLCRPAPDGFDRGGRPINRIGSSSGRLAHGKVVRNLAGPDLEMVNAVALSGDGRRLLTGSGKHVARLWDVDDGMLLHTFGRDAGSHWTTPVALSPDGRWAAYGSVEGDTEIAVYDTTTGNQARALVGYQRGLRKLTFSPDGRRLAAAGLDDVVRLWDLVTGQEVLSRPAPRNVVDLRFGRAGRRLAAVAIDGTLRVWNGE